MRRRYAGLITQASYAGSRVAFGGNYTLSRAYGNVEAETVNGGPSGASIHHYPEYRQAAWNYPHGDLSIDQRHRARGWATYSVPMDSSAGALDLGIVQQFGSGVPYGAVAVSTRRRSCPIPVTRCRPLRSNISSPSRDAFRTEATYRTDAVAQLLAPPSEARPEVFFHGEVLNVFNQFQLCGCGDTIFNNGGLTDMTTIGTSVVLRAPFNPYTTQPVQGTNWDTHANFGTPLNTFAFTTPRFCSAFLIGVRF